MIFIAGLFCGKNCQNRDRGDDNKIAETDQYFTCDCIHRKLGLHALTPLGGEREAFSFL